MSDDPENSLSQRLDDTLIREYLLENPDFFSRNEDLLTTLQVSHREKGTVSLVERQQQKLRLKVKELEEEITELMVNARRNETIFSAYSNLYVRLLRCSSVSEVLDQLQLTFEKELDMPALSLKFFNSPIELEEQYTFASDTHKQLLGKRFSDDPIYLGRLTEHEQKLLFREENVASVALMLLGEQGEIGMLAVGSADPGHFEPAMDKLLITQLQALLTALLATLLASDDAA
ncbi:DUF484 family protein [Idiomarina seosinensis]|uniref:DUF484 domain-containing protein n=1 Tax=Idiomarina seosinensis TaxID=281739 RepID=A0A432Z6P2_9GAMM|nr:DUF484 family protein [Idiomarina seosinensis]RUO73551.1 DUF484 domain-containing protein [Idiomarina seosinensis]